MKPDNAALHTEKGSTTSMGGRMPYIKTLFLCQLSHWTLSAAAPAAYVDDA